MNYPPSEEADRLARGIAETRAAVVEDAETLRQRGSDAVHKSRRFASSVGIAMLALLVLVASVPAVLRTARARRFRWWRWLA